MKNGLHYIIFLGTLLALSSCMQKNKLPDLRETYNYKDAKPFGAKLAFEMLSNVYEDKYVNINDRPFADFRRNTYSDSASLYMAISQKIFFSEEDVEDLLAFAEEGHTVFLSAAWIDTVLLDKLLLAQTGSEWMDYLSRYSDTRSSLQPDEYSSQDTFKYFYRPAFNSFKDAGGSAARVMGKNAQNEANFILFFKGRGRIYLHCEPRLFSNYFLLTKNNYLYMKQVLQLMSANPGNIYWDNYFNRHNYRESDSRGSALSILFKHPELTAAFWIILTMLLFYILFNGKRKQRLVPVIKPVENTSIEFSNAIAGLYLAEKNNKTIAEKMITYFNDFVRNKYFLHGYSNNAELASMLSKKSGVAEDKVQALYLAMEQVQLAYEVSDFELLSLNEQIQYFYKNRN